MITVEEAKATFEARLSKNLVPWSWDFCSTERSETPDVSGSDLRTGDALADDSQTTQPHLVSLSLRPPSEGEMLSDQLAAERWARQWRQVRPIPGMTVCWQTRSWRSIGKQEIPVRATLSNASALAQFVGGAPYQRWQRMVSRFTTLQHSLGTSQALGAAVRRHGAQLTDLDDEDFSKLLQVVVWLIAHPDSGMRPRQLPVRGVDTKWFGRHRRLVTDLVLAAAHPQGAQPDIGIVSNDPLIRMRILDPSLIAGAVLDFAAPSWQIDELDLHPQALFIFENLENVLVMPDWPGAVVVHGGGFGVDVVAKIPWVQRSQVIYWGDLDSHGFAILNRLRSHHDNVKSVLMDEQTLLAYRDLWVPEPVLARGVLPCLTDSEDAARQRLIREGNVRLEQERIPWQAALTALRQVASG